LTAILKNALIKFLNFLIQVAWASGKSVTFTTNHLYNNHISHNKQVYIF